ncbi:hypothetical protein [Chitinophaga filiformis]|uniref:Uncharacterized protein n=1 Tax=Chitinophaga filiformis TaxID=104663 RepID=A0A1G7NTJ0_CHIFI|nr:hypothetical protein [Chitinophaga filiformis]SDF77281.1 hypothetical protein SAMN04488121_102932 [Chitinophaga filiformis]
MSMLKSLYVRIKIQKDNLERFLQDKPVEATVDQDWTSWWDSRDMYGKQPLSKIYFYQTGSNREVLATTANEFRIGKEEQMEDGVEEWIFCVVFFSENYEESLAMLTWLRSIAPYMDPDGEGVALIYDFFWGSGVVMAHLEFTGQKVSFRLTKDIAELDPALLAAANNSMETAFDAVSAYYGETD